MLFIFGFKTREDRIGSHVMGCEVCGAAAAQVLIRRTTKLSLFFIPLIPVRRAQYYVQCSHCGSVRTADPRMVHAIAG